MNDKYTVIYRPTGTLNPTELANWLDDFCQKNNCKPVLFSGDLFIFEQVQEEKPKPTHQRPLPSTTLERLLVEVANHYVAATNPVDNEHQDVEWIRAIAAASPGRETQAIDFALSIRDQEQKK